MTGLYLHIPFCAKKCPYCAFYSLPYQSALADAYVRALMRSMESYTLSDKVDTIYFGGGTPSLLRAAQVYDLLCGCAKCFSLAPDAEITLEYNPTGQRKDYLHALRHAGVNRLSIGVQSFSDRELAALGRTHTAENARRTVLDALDAGFRNLSCDVMLGIPGQSRESLKATLAVLGTLPITHVSAYLLQIEAGTPFAENPALLSECPHEDTQADFYLQTVKTLETMGLFQYEVSSFAREGFESRHNLKYWQCEPYLGLGAGAHSCCFGKRFRIKPDIEAYLAAARPEEELLSDAPCDLEERCMLGLRTTKGVQIKELAGKDRIPALQAAGYLTVSGDRVALTPAGFAVSNAVIAELLTG